MIFKPTAFLLLAGLSIALAAPFSELFGTALSTFNGLGAPKQNGPTYDAQHLVGAPNRNNPAYDVQNLADSDLRGEVDSAAAYGAKAIGQGVKVKDTVVKTVADIARGALGAISSLN